MSQKKADKIRAAKRAREEKKRLAKIEKKKAKEEKKKQKAENPKPKMTLGEITDMTGMILAIVKTVLGKFFGHLRVKVARFKITLASGDPALTAIAYGAVTQTVSYIIALLHNSKNVRGLVRENVDIRTDFLSETPQVDIKISFSLRVWHLFHVAFSALGKLLRSKFIKNKFKQMNSGGKQPTEENIIK